MVLCYDNTTKLAYADDNENSKSGKYQAHVVWERKRNGANNNYDGNLFGE